MASIFTKIGQGDIPGHFVAKDEEFFAILDIKPLRKGHVLVIPFQEVDYIYDLPADVIGRYFEFAQRVAKAIKKCIPCDRIGTAVVGLEVPHAHVHLIPIDKIEDMNFSKPKLELSQEELAEVAQQIADQFI
jgi:histidine triad (HIT) family protein